MEKRRLVRKKKEDKKKGSWRDKEKRFVYFFKRKLGFALCRFDGFSGFYFIYILFLLQASSKKSELARPNAY